MLLPGKPGKGGNETGKTSHNLVAELYRKIGYMVLRISTF